MSRFGNLRGGSGDVGRQIGRRGPELIDAGCLGGLVRAPSPQCEQCRRRASWRGLAGRLSGLLRMLATGRRSDG